MCASTTPSKTPEPPHAPAFFRDRTPPAPRLPGGRQPRRPGRPLRRAVSLRDRPAHRNALGRLRAAWSARVSALGAAGWPDASTEGRRLGLATCPPSVAFGPHGRACLRRTICPHCWGREAYFAWKGLDAALYRVVHARRGPAACDLVTRSIMLPLGPPRAGDDPCGRVSNVLRQYLGAASGTRRLTPRRLGLRRLGRDGVLGGLEFARVDVVLGHDGAWRYVLRVSQILLLEPGDAASFAASPRAALWAKTNRDQTKIRARVVVKARPHPKRTLTARLVADAYRYPEGLMAAPADLVVPLLAARGGQRLGVAFGALYGRSTRRPVGAA